MSTITNRPMPNDILTLRRYYLPDEPTDSTVSWLRAAIPRLDEAAVAARNAVEECLHHHRDLVEEIIGAAIDGTSLDDIAARMTPDGLPELVHRSEQLNEARQLAHYRLEVAERTDPDHVAWIAACRAVEHAWHDATFNVNSNEERFNNLLAFTQRHNLADHPTDE